MKQILAGVLHVFISDSPHADQAMPLIIDVHLHAHTLSMYGEPVPTVCTNDQSIIYPGRDPRTPWDFTQLTTCPRRMAAPSTDELHPQVHL